MLKKKFFVNLHDNSMIILINLSTKYLRKLQVLNQ